MKIHYLGTAAAEGLPSVFCNCETCKRARELGGKNIHTRSQVLINDELLLDLPSDTYIHSLLQKTPLDLVQYMLVTHSHMDHFYPNELLLRGFVYAYDLRKPKLKVLSNAVVADKYNTMSKDFNNEVASNIDWEIAKVFKTYELGEYKIIPLPANHMSNEQALIYIITHNGKTMLYGNDTGYPFDSVFEYIEKERIKFDLLSLDCTMVLNPVPDTGTHMGFEGCNRTVERLKSMHALNDGCKVIVTHFSHNGKKTYEQLCQIGKEKDMLVAYDGLVIKL